MAKSPLAKFLEILKKYLDGNASDDEVRFIEDYYERFANEQKIAE